MPYRGVATICGVLPVAINVLVPLPLLISRPCAVLPGIVVVSSDPIWPVMNAGPLDVRTGRSSVGPCTLGKADAPDGAEAGCAPAAKAGPPSPTSDPDATSKAVRRLWRTLSALIITISFFALSTVIRRHTRRYCDTLP